MAKKKKKKRGATENAPSAKEIPFNNPFAELKNSLKPLVKEEPAPPPEAPPAAPAPEDEEAVFRLAMAGVEPLKPKGGPEVARRPERPSPRLDAEPDEELEVLAQLADLIAGGGEFDLRLTGQFLQGAAPGVSPQLLERLAGGEFPVQDYLDLHGLGEDQALEEVERFLARAATRGLRHVLIVHGKGRGSPDGVPVIKRALARRLFHKRMLKRVLAFCTALPVDGGAGAMYVLLRKWSGPRGAWPGHEE